MNIGVQIKVLSKVIASAKVMQQPFFGETFLVKKIIIRTPVEYKQVGR